MLSLLTIKAMLRVQHLNYASSGISLSFLKIIYNNKNQCYNSSTYDSRRLNYFLYETVCELLWSSN